MFAHTHTQCFTSIEWCLQRLKVAFNNEFSGIETIIHTKSVGRRTPTHTRTLAAHAHTLQQNVCVPRLPSLQCNDDWVSPLDWLLSRTAIPLSTVRNHLVSLGLLQSNWPFKEGLHHVKQCNWEWYSRCSIPPFCPPSIYPCVSLPPWLQLLPPSHLSLSRPAALGVSLPFNIAPVAPCLRLTLADL